MTSEPISHGSATPEAVNTSDQNASGKTTQLPGGYTRLPNGVVLDKEGKPCRSCNSFANWKQATSMIKQGGPASMPGKSSSLNATPTLGTADNDRGPAQDCPADVETLGRSTWTLLHSIAATYPETPSPTQKSDLLSFVKLFSKLYPCWVCADDFRGYVARQTPQVGNRSEFGMWLCGAHNEVNRKLGKPDFDCSKWEQRWRAGWKDGRCN